MEQRIRTALAGDETILDRIPLTDIEREIGLAPYSAALCSLKAAAAHAQQSEGFSGDLERAAARVLSRRHLKERIEGLPVLELFWITGSPSAPEPEQTGSLPGPAGTTLPEEATEDTAAEEDMAAAAIGEEAEPHAPETNLPLLPAENGFTFGFVKKPRRKTRAPAAVENTLLQTPPVRTQARTASRPEDALIDSFLEKNPSIKSPAIPFGEPEEIRDLAGTSVVLQEEIVTENMAFILMKQKNYGKARELFRKLQLKNPEKSDYFAALIKNLDAQLPS